MAKSKGWKQISATNLAVILAIAIIAIVLLYGGTSTAKFYSASKASYAQKQAQPIKIAQPPAQAKCAPSGPEVCDGRDNDCNGKTDDSLPQYNYYKDNDKDTYGDAIAPAFYNSPTCYSEPQAGQSITKDDCDDTNAAINPRATEICGNSNDDNCDGQIDETCEICDGIDNDGNGITDDGAVCNTQGNCGAYGNTCAAGQQCAYDETLVKFNCV